MTKADLVQNIARATGIDKSAVVEVIENLMSEIKSSISNGEKVYFRGFGTFSTKLRARKVARDINCNSALIVPEHTIPFFKPCNEFKKMVK